MKYKDEIVEEVRKVRQRQAEKFDYDISAIVADLRKTEKKTNRRIVSRLDESVRPNKKAA